MGRLDIDNGAVAVVRQGGDNCRVQLLLPDDYPEFTVVKDHDATAILRDYAFLSRHQNESKLAVFRIFPVKNGTKSNVQICLDKGRTRPAPPDNW